MNLKKQLFIINIIIAIAYLNNNFLLKIYLSNSFLKNEFLPTLNGTLTLHIIPGCGHPSIDSPSSL